MSRLVLENLVPTQYARGRMVEVINKITTQLNGLSEGRISNSYSATTSVPTTGTFQVGDFTHNSNTTDLGGYVLLGWLCVAAGTPGTQLPIYAGTSAPSTGGGAVNVQTFTASGTWTKPAGTSASTRVLVEVVGGGGGGAGAPSGGRGGGSGGGAGSYNCAWFFATDLGATETITIGAGGAGTAGAASSGPSPAGTGGTSSFGSWLFAYGGGGGYFGQSGVDCGGGGGGGTIGPGGGNGSGSSLGGTGGLQGGAGVLNGNLWANPFGTCGGMGGQGRSINDGVTSPAGFGPTGGGGGAGGVAGKIGGSSLVSGTTSTVAAAGGTTNGQSGASLFGTLAASFKGAGGGGGACGNAVNGGNGGKGQQPGGGGGGAGASVTGSVGGTGGDGAPGGVRVTVFF